MITCGNRKAHNGRTGQHTTVAMVKLCYSSTETWACSWLLPFVHPEDGEVRTYECGALSWNTDRGHTCENGHEHVRAEIMAAEGWDYAADEDEAGLLAGRGVHPVAMNGGHIDVNLDAMHYAASLG